MKRFSQKFNSGMKNPDPFSEKKKEGEINIEYTPENNKSHHSEDGEYVDFEEIK